MPDDEMNYPAASRRGSSFLIFSKSTVNSYYKMVENEPKKYKTYKINPPKAFNTVFSHFYGAINSSALSITKILSPSFQTVLIFNLAENNLSIRSEYHSFEIEKWMVLGPLKRAITYTIPPHGEFFVVNFKDDSFYRFFEQAIIDSSASTNTKHLKGMICFDGIWHQLKELNNPSEYPKYIIDFGQNYLGESDTVVKKIIEYREDEAIDPIKYIAEERSISKRYVQKKHKKHFGYSAKEISRYKRFSKTLNFLEEKTTKNETVDWFDIIAQFGYYDQSQLIHEFNHYLNCTPGNYLEFQKDICVIKTE